MEDVVCNGPCLHSLLSITYAKNTKRLVVSLHSRPEPTAPFLCSPPLSAVYIKGPSRRRCHSIKYIHFLGFYSAAHLLNIYEWCPLNSFQFTFKAGFIGTTEVQQLMLQWQPTPLHLLHKRHSVNSTKLSRRSTSLSAS